MELYKRRYDNQYLTIDDFAKITGLSKNRIRLYLCRAEFDGYWLKDRSKKYRVLILYNEITYNLFKKFLGSKPVRQIEDEENA